MRRITRCLTLTGRPYLLPLLTLFIVPLGGAPWLQAHSRTPLVEFDLDYPNTHGALDPGAPFDLAVRLSDVSKGRDSLVAIIEGKPFVRRLVPMMYLPQEDAYRASVRLEPYLTGLVTPREMALRVDVTFATLRGMKLVRFLTHSVYVTMTLPAQAAELNTASYSEAGEEVITGVELGREGRTRGDLDGPEFVWPMVTEHRADITEHDLMLGGPPTVEPAYWTRISHLITRSWSGPASRVRRTKAKGTVKVGFRLYANGEAQLIHVERTSGSRTVDEAALQAILNAHPFPPFPANLGHEFVDLHVDLSRSGRAVHRAVRPAASRAGTPRSARP